HLDAACRISILRSTIFILRLHVLFPLRHFSSFPTRRSSDLRSVLFMAISGLPPMDRMSSMVSSLRSTSSLNLFRNRRESTTQLRSEEHTSELQSRFDLVCLLLLEKKNTDTTCMQHTI